MLKRATNKETPLSLFANTTKVFDRAPRPVPDCNGTNLNTTENAEQNTNTPTGGQFHSVIIRKTHITSACYFFLFTPSTITTRDAG